LNSRLEPIHTAALAPKPVPTAIMGQVLDIVYSVIAKKAGFTKKMAQTGAVTFIQRFGSALNLNSISICCFSTVCISRIHMDQPGSVGLRLAGAGCI